MRAREPTQGLDKMRQRRSTDDLRLLCSGPGRLGQALGVTREHDGLALDEAPFELLARSAPVEVATAPRIGISRAVELPWRYCLAGSPFLSRAVPRS